MDFLENVLDRLAKADSLGYHAGSHQASEPTALAAMALLAHGRDERAVAPLRWLLQRQTDDGSVGIDAEQSTPGWPTGWAILAWRAAGQSRVAEARFNQAIERALQWTFRSQGSIIEHIDSIGHDTTIKGWPWVDGTHAWVEPTAMNLLALKHTGHGQHERAHEAVRLLEDRLLVSGGANYGNTVVFGQELRAHLEPTGLCLLALAGERDKRGRVKKSIAYVQRELGPPTTTVSLCYAVLGLAAQGHPAERSDEWLAAAAERTIARDASAYKLALLALAALGEACPLNPQRARQS